MDHLETTYKFLIPSFMPAITHPLTYARTMMLVSHILSNVTFKLGYEPFPPVRRFTLRNILRPNYEVYYYPSVFTYCKFLQQLSHCN